MKFLKLDTFLNTKVVDTDRYESPYLAISKNVGGLIESAGYVFGLHTSPIDFFVNEEGLIKCGFKPLLVYEGRPIMGDGVFIRYDEDGNFVSLEDEDIRKIKDYLSRTKIVEVLFRNERRFVYKPTEVLA